MITVERQGQRVYLTGDTFAVKDQIKRMGGHWDGDRRAWWVGAKKEAEARALVDGLSAAPPADPTAPKPGQNPDDVRLTGKGRYKGREYYAGAVTRDGTRVRLLTLPDAQGEYLDFWVPCAEVEQTKAYTPRERTFRGRTTTEYTTLGSIARFLARKRREEQQLAAGEVPAGYCVDLEDGMLKPRAECDMPAD